MTRQLAVHAAKRTARKRKPPLRSGSSVADSGGQKRAASAYNADLIHGVPLAFGRSDSARAGGNLIPILRFKSGPEVPPNAGCGTWIVELQDVSDLAELSKPTFNLLASRGGERDGTSSHVIMCRSEAGAGVLIKLDPEISAADAAKICEILSRGVTEVHVQPGIAAALN